MENELIDKIVKDVTMRLKNDDLRKEIDDTEYLYGWKQGQKCAFMAILDFIHEQRKHKKLEVYAIVDTAKRANKIISVYDSYEIANNLKVAFPERRSCKIVKMVEE